MSSGNKGATKGTGKCLDCGIHLREVLVGGMDVGAEEDKWTMLF